MAFSYPSCPTLVGWSPPSKGFFKLSFDSNAIWNMGLAGIGGVFRDSASESILSLSGLVGSCSVNKAEMLSMRTSLMEAHLLNLQNLMVEGNSLCAIRWASGRSSPHGDREIWQKRSWV